VNAIQLREAIDLLIDRSRNARFSFNQYNLAVRQAQIKIFNQYCDDEVGVREWLYTLLTTVTPTITSVSATTTYAIKHFNYASDFEYFSRLDVFVDSVLTEVFPIANDEVNRMLQDTFKIPNARKTYHLEDATGYKLYCPPTGTITAEFTYLASPADFSIGQESNVITAGGALVLSTAYLAIDTSVYNGVTYIPGATITGTGANLTSGSVIATSNTVPSNLPASVHEDLAKVAAEFLMGSVANYPAAQFSASEMPK
jgi:hypothetical protein